MEQLFEADSTKEVFVKYREAITLYAEIYPVATRDLLLAERNEQDPDTQLQKKKQDSLKSLVEIILEIRKREPREFEDVLANTFSAIQGYIERYKRQNPGLLPDTLALAEVVNALFIAHEQKSDIEEHRKGTSERVKTAI